MTYSTFRSTPDTCIFVRCMCGTLITPYYNMEFNGFSVTVAMPSSTWQSFINFYLYTYRFHQGIPSAEGLLHSTDSYLTIEKTTDVIRYPLVYRKHNIQVSESNTLDGSESKYLCSPQGLRPFPWTHPLPSPSFSLLPPLSPTLPI